MQQLMTAPLAGITDYAFRQTCRDFSKDGIYFAEMISARSLLNSLSQAKKSPQEKFDAGEYVQIFGDDPVIMAEAAKILEDRGAAHININMGCPVKKVWKAYAGAQLMSDLPRAEEIMRMVKEAVAVPVSVKTRIGVNDETITAFEMVKIAAETGMDWLGVHGRTRTQMYAGLSNWDVIADLADKATIPIIGNGDIFTEETALKRLAIPKLGGIILARGIMGKPWLLASIENVAQGKEPIRLDRTELKDLVLRHLERTLDLYGVLAGIRIFRKHLGWYSKGIEGGADFRSKINQIEDSKILNQTIQDFF
ncbi:MAG: tRNA dihydrouridine synthase DusB [Alphaproteobacteria bacterium]|nr:tRNA dihydrouridine synthase DusB [Alphaproteobacteria bacterium]